MKDRLAIAAICIVSLLVLAGVGFVLLGQRGEIRSDFDVSGLPTLNAFLNGTSAVLLSIGYFFIRRKNVILHKICMLTAFGLSSLFLISYLTYHFQAGSVPFEGIGLVRMIYFPMLVSHILLAAMIVPLALMTIYRAWAGQFVRHKRIARFTFPVWLYVSVTGVVVYWMLYWMAPQR